MIWSSLPVASGTLFLAPFCVNRFCYNFYATHAPGHLLTGLTHRTYTVADRDHYTNVAANAHRTAQSLTIGMSDRAIKIVSKQLTGSDSSLPPLTMQIICLVDSYMIWVGTTSDGRGEQVEGGAELAPLQGQLARDWACAMPPVRFRY